MYDIIFCTIPAFFYFDSIYPAPAMLSGVVNSAGYKSTTYDFAFDLYKICNKDKKYYAPIVNYLMNPNIHLDETCTDLLETWHQQTIKKILSADAKYIGMSIFSLDSHRAATELLIRLKKIGLNDRIVVGGRGLDTPAIENTLMLFPESKKTNTFADFLLENKLIAHAIRGDGEQAILEFLSTNSVNKTPYRDSNFDYPLPNYSNYNFDEYDWMNDEISLRVTGSRGCVRNCDFCDIKEVFGNYRFDDGNNLARRLIEYQKIFKINKFVLTDSLSNGSLREFQKFITTLSEYNQTAEIPIKWSCQYICRDFSKSENYGKDDYYRKLKMSGAEGLTIGAEAGSNHVLEMMDKKTTVEALLYELDNFRKYNITCVLLFFSGHWSEHEEDFITYCHTIKQLIPYLLSGVVSTASFASAVQLLPGSPMFNNPDILRNEENSNLWLHKDNRKNTYKQRIKRALAIAKLFHKFGVGNRYHNLMLEQDVEYIKTNFKEINNFFVGKSEPTDFLDDVDKFTDDFITNSDDQTLTLTLELDVAINNNSPYIKIVHNNQTVLNQQLLEGPHRFNFRLKAEDKNKIKMFMYGKGSDSLIDDNGNLIKDTYIKIKNIYLNNFDIFSDYNLFSQLFTTKASRIVPGFWSDYVDLSLEFENNFSSMHIIPYLKNSSNIYNPVFDFDENIYIKFLESLRLLKI